MAKHRIGFSVVEMLLVIAIVSLLLGLILPAIQKVREAASRVQCASNLRQFGIALASYHENKNRLPPGGRVRNLASRKQQATRLDPMFIWMENQGSWLLHTLPYVEQQPLYNLFPPYLKADNSDMPEIGGCGDGREMCNIRKVNGGKWYAIAPPNLLRCPSYSHDYIRWPASNYGGSIGPQCIWGPCGYDPYLKYCNQPQYGIPRDPFFVAAYGNLTLTQSIRGCFNRTGARVQFRDITDGTSHTIMVGEVSPQENISASSFYAYELATGHWLDPNAGYGHAHTLAPINYPTHVQKECNPWNSSTAEAASFGEAKEPTTSDQELLEHSWQNYHLSQGFKSRHPGGANYLFAEGSVYFLKAAINHQLYQFLGCRNDGQAITLASNALPEDP